jgi:uncharacterized delta-60 repeat protein
MRAARLLALLLAAQLTAVGTTAAAPPHAGSFDPSFGENGRVTLRLPGEPFAPAAVAIQPDRRIVVAGTLPGAVGTWPGEWSGRAFAMRFLPDGALDPAFGDGGIARAAYPYPVSIEGLALQPDGALVLSGITQDGEGTYRGVVARLLPSGDVDEAFGSSGITRLSGAGGYPVNFLTHIGVQTDGRIVAAGSQWSFDPHTVADPYVVRLTPDGAPDESFGDEGRAAIGTARPIAVLPLPDGDTVVVGTDEEYFGGSGITLLRVRGGANDLAYHRYRSSLTGVGAQVRADGTIDFVGQLVNSIAQPDRRFLAHARIGQDLELLEQDKVRKDDLLAATFDSRGAVLTAGTWLYPYDAPPFRIERYREMRRLDRSFGGRRGARNVFFERPGELTGLAMQDDRLIVAGYTHPRQHASQGTSLTLVGLHARQDGSGPRLYLKLLPRHGCLSGTATMLVLARDESRTTTRVSIDRHRLATSTEHRFGIELNATHLRPGRHTLRIHSVDAAGNRSAISRILRVCG